MTLLPIRMMLSSPEFAGSRSWLVVNSLTVGVLKIRTEPPTQASVLGFRPRALQVLVICVHASYFELCRGLPEASLDG